MSDSATMSVRALHRTDLPKLSLSTKAAATVLAIVAAVALPQLFHVIGAVSGQVHTCLAWSEQHFRIHLHS